MSIMTSWKYGVYHLLPICSAHIEVRIKWCLIPPFFFKLHCKRSGSRLCRFTTRRNSSRCPLNSRLVWLQNRSWSFCSRVVSFAPCRESNHRFFVDQFVEFKHNFPIVQPLTQSLYRPRYPRVTAVYKVT